MAPAREPEVTVVARRAVEHLARTQDASGSWKSDYGGPMFLLPMYVALAWTAGRLTRAEQMVTFFRNVQRADGSFGLHAEASSGSMFTSVLGYVALRLLGVGADDPAPRALLKWIHTNGTPLGMASWGKFTLCLLGLYEWEGIVPLLPELWLLPASAPAHPSKLWCHARMVYLPMAWLYGRKVRANAHPLLGAIRAELFEGAYERIDWAAHRDRVAPSDDYRPASGALKGVNRAQVGLERVAGLVRARALAECLRLIRHEDASTGDLDIGPVNAVLNMFVHHFRGAEGREDFERGWPKFDEAYLWPGHDGLKMQGYNSAELWDTAFTLQALETASKAGLVERVAASPVLERAGTFLRDNQILDDVPEFERNYRHRSRGGWPFSTRRHGWPITDCTAEGLKCALQAGRLGISSELFHSSVELLLGWQNDDGGWGTYERQRSGTWLEALNPSSVFGDIMVDTSFVECTSAVVQALAAAQKADDLRARWDSKLSRSIARGMAFLRAAQRDDGSFEGSWAVCFTYGTWFGVKGLLAGGARSNDAALVKASQFLLGKQRADGSWSEHGDTCRERRWLEGTEGHSAQTSWALSALARVDGVPLEAMERAGVWLRARQSDDGSWPREPLVGVFNRTCLINYDCYRNYFPLWALADLELCRRNEVLP